MKALIVGLGNLGEGLLSGLGKDIFEVIYCAEPNAEKHKLPPHARWVGKEKVPTLDILFLCVKPHDLPQAAERWRDQSCKVLVSFLAGTPLDKLKKNFPRASCIVRAMPNIAATIGEAATCACASKATDLTLVEKSLRRLGDLHWVKEEMLDAVTGLSGSGPAYVYLMIEALADGGVRVGLPRNLALELATQTVLGAAKLLKERKVHPAVLRDQVVTPAGTTIAGLHELESHGMRAMLMDAVYEATRRCKEIQS